MKCIKCGETDITQFYPSLLKRYIYKCKRCCYLSYKEWRKRHREECNAIQKKYYSTYAPQLKTDILTHYSSGKICCAECGATTKLSIDHINGGGDKHRLDLGFNSSYQFYLWLKRNNYPEGYRVLCIHCNSHIKSSSGRKCQPTSKLIKRTLRLGLSRSKDIADRCQSANLTRRAIFEALRRLIKKGEITRIGKGLYQLV